MYMHTENTFPKKLHEGFMRSMNDIIHLILILCEYGLPVFSGKSYCFVAC